MLFTHRPAPGWTPGATDEEINPGKGPPPSCPRLCPRNTHTSPHTCLRNGAPSPSQPGNSQMLQKTRLLYCCPGLSCMWPGLLALRRQVQLPSWPHPRPKSPLIPVPVPRRSHGHTESRLHEHNRPGACFLSRIPLLAPPPPGAGKGAQFRRRGWCCLQTHRG